MRKRPTKNALTNYQKTYTYTLTMNAWRMTGNVTAAIRLLKKTGIVCIFFKIISANKRLGVPHKGNLLETIFSDDIYPGAWELSRKYAKRSPRLKVADNCCSETSLSPYNCFIASSILRRACC